MKTKKTLEKTKAFIKEFASWKKNKNFRNNN